MPVFYDVHPFVVQPEKSSSGKSNYWNILNAGGVRLAVMYHRREFLPLRLVRAMGLSINYPAHIVVEDPEGQRLFTFRKGLSVGYFRATVLDGDGTVLGTVRERKLGLQGRQYLLADREGTVLGRLEGDWRSYSLQMRDARNSVIGKITRKSEDLNKVIFPEKSPFYVVQLYIPQSNLVFKKLLLGTSAAMALLLR